MNKVIYALEKENNTQSAAFAGRSVLPKQFSPVASFISKHSACDMAHYKVVTGSTSLSKPPQKESKIPCFPFHNQPEGLRP